ncbi:MAG TPA: right-handed parallel beta-helix repeat-containing protein [Thermoanaerobaculia bacterium]|jgi:hypothetical protein|nr:right-handed parallel beta-helix repeat-containing protein [Thermoanaerobaculia bacterium]
MRKSMQLRIFATALFALLATASLAHAQATRTWVSGVGDDANPCSRTAPCKTFAGAISKTAPCGEIDVLDPGGFGALTITKCISIEADGLIAGVLVSGTQAFIVAAGNGDNVMIRGLTFDGLGTGLNAIRITSAGKVFVQNCQINNFTQQGIDFEPSNAGTELFVTNTTIRDTGNFSLHTGGGILIKPVGNVNVNATIIGTHLQGNNVGMLVQDGGQVTMKDSEAVGNSFAGLNVTATTVAASLFLNQVVSANNGGDGVKTSGGTATMRVADTSVTNNAGIGFNNTGGFFGSFGNNWVNGNTGGETGGTISPLTLH